MNREELVARTAMKYGYTKYQATKIAHEIIRNLTAYLKVEEQRQAKMQVLLNNAVEAQKKAKDK